MEVPRKRAKARPSDDGIADGGAKSPTAAQQIAELQAELERCKTEHDQMVSDLKGSYSGALEWAYSVETIPAREGTHRGLRGCNGFFSGTIQTYHQETENG